MLDDIARALAQLGDPRIRAVLIKSALATLALLLACGAGVGYLVAHFIVPEDWPRWLGGVIGWLAWAALSWIFFSALATLVVSLFLDDAAAAVEARHYPGLPPARRQGAGELLREGLRFALVSILANLVALPVYLLVPAINLLVFYGLNGYLLSREYFELAAFRRLPPREGRRLRRSHPARLLLVGVVIAFLLTVPVVNLIAPVLATSLMVHVYHRLAGEAAPGRTA
jgi:uncharacterized protein involved in cysteine biosynthesis